MSALPRVLNTPLSQTSMVGSWILRENNRTPGILSRTHKGLVIAPVLTCHILVYVLGRGSRNKATHRNPSSFYLLNLLCGCLHAPHPHTSMQVPHTPEQRSIHFCCCYSFLSGVQSKFTQAFQRFCQLGFCILFFFHWNVLIPYLTSLECFLNEGYCDYGGR